jgi:predicted CXXCH cytochrome family protein
MRRDALQVLGSGLPIASEAKPRDCELQIANRKLQIARTLRRAIRSLPNFQFAIFSLQSAIVCLLFFSGIASAAPTTLPAKAPKPREAIGQEGCVREECHASVRAYGVLHGPVAANTCDACHQLTDAEAHTFALTRQKQELCTYCHEMNFASFPVLHKPLANGECLGCHDPHGGSAKNLIREESVEALCHRCHESITADKSFLHTPVKQGACDACHPSHGSKFPKLLDVAGPDLCLACHESFERSMAQAKFTHKALDEGCQKCHDVHGSNHAMATTQPTVVQCTGCHEKIKNEATASRYPHTPVMKDDACVTCHTPHGSSLAKLVSDVPEKLCMECHKTEQKTTRGYVVQPVTELMTSDAHRHGGIKDGTCSGCHVAHGSNQQLFLTKHYSRIFYQKFSPQKYELCFSCHDVKLVDEPKTTTLTAFRNGEQNLHTLHVRDTQERGESCRVCHNSHAGDNKSIVRDIIRYGAWEMPVRFKKSPTGGSCYPGCHPNYGYDRDRPVKNTTGLPTSPGLMPVSTERPSIVSIDATDATGTKVKVPSGAGPTIIALLRADQREGTPHALDLLAASLRAAGDARVVVLLSGSGAQRQAKPLAASRKLPVIADEDCTLAGDLEVRGWPTILVIAKDGLEIARLGGAVETLPVKLPPYLDFAAGRIDRASATTRAAATRPAVGDDPARRAVRDIERLLAAGRAKDALDLLVNLPDGTLPNWQHNLLGAKTLIALNRWAEAKAAATAALQQRETLRDAHYLLGQIYEHEKDFAKASAAYRAAAGVK